MFLVLLYDAGHESIRGDILQDDFHEGPRGAFSGGVDVDADGGHGQHQGEHKHTDSVGFSKAARAGDEHVGAYLHHVAFLHDASAVLVPFAVAEYFGQTGIDEVFVEQDLVRGAGGVFEVGEPPLEVVESLVAVAGSGDGAAIFVDGPSNVGGCAGGLLGVNPGLEVAVHILVPPGGDDVPAPRGSALLLMRAEGIGEELQLGELGFEIGLCDG